MRGVIRVTLLRQYLRMGLLERRVTSCRKLVSRAKVFDVVSSMSRLALKSFPNPTFPITSKLSLCKHHHRPPSRSAEDELKHCI